jgi:flagellar basal-body rod protein FlgC
MLDIASSGMSAQSIRLNALSSNLANAESVSSTESGAYRSRQAVFKEGAHPFSQAFDSALSHSGVGVEVAAIVQSNAPIRKEFHPDNVMADNSGYVYLPNVNVIEEMANMISASRSYQTNVEVLNTGKQLMLQTLRLGE